MKKGDRDQQSQVGGIPLDCRYGNHEMDSFCPTDPWDQTPNSNMNFYEPNTSSLMGMASMVNHFSINANNDGNPPPFDPYCNPTTRAVVSQSRRNHNGVVMVGGIGEGPSDDMSVGDGQGMQESGNLQGVGISGNDSGNTNPASGSQEYPPSKALAAKKRKTSAQEVGMEHVKEEGGNDEDRDGDGSNQRNEQEGTLKLSGKHGKEKVDLQKEDYIHVRARRGQATNSHSLAERVRREKISERMKLLQDLVPGCNKVTGKAVMLDEIINYVQSLQRQVEFLSMKLAAINPQLNFNIEGLLSKDVLLSHTGSSSTPGFPPDMVHPFLHQNLQDLIQSGNFGMPAPPDALRRAVSGQVASMNMLKESKSQVPMAWEGELHNGMQMNFSGSQPLNIQDINARSRDGFHM